MRERIIIIFAVVLLIHIILAESIYAQDKKRIAILDFSNVNTSETYARAVRNIFEVSLYKTDVFQILERDQMEEILKEQGFQMSGCIDTSCAVEIGKILSADLVVMASLNKLGSYTVTVKFVNVREGNLALADSESAETDDAIRDAVKILANRMAGIFSGTKPISVNAEEKSKSKNDKEEEDTNVSSPHVVNYNLFVRGAYLAPLGSFNDLIETGYGIVACFNIENLYRQNFSIGIEAGFLNSPGKKKNVDRCTMIPAIISAMYKYNIFERFSIMPVLGAGVSYNTISYDKDGVSDGEAANYNENSKAEFIAKAGIMLSIAITDAVPLQIGAEHCSIFEEDKGLYFLSLYAGIGIRI
ncbi:MAG: CsgG/HfaB family protein [Spirochaetota bacterium]|nr:CsgG/HfaB family protein [Spirochaetota bacterium]